MTDRQLEERLRAALEAAAPNDPQAVLSRCTQRKGSVIVMKKNTKALAIGLAAAAACLAVGFAGYTGLNRQVTGFVTLDVNPSIQLDLNRKERVVRAEPLNGDGADILDGMDLKGVQAEVAVNALLGSMVSQGYLTEAANSVLISVQNKDPAAADSLRQRLDSAAAAGMENGAVISQVLTADPELTEKARQYGISTGKAQLIEEIAEENVKLTFEELTDASVNDLNLLAAGTAAHSSGTASENGYIGKAAAEKIALDSVRAKNARMLPTDFDMENGRMVYEVEFVADSVGYEIEVDALTGAILSTESEKPDRDHLAVPTDPNAEAKAMQTAFDKAGVKPEEVKNLRVEQDRENGKTVFEYEFTAGGFEYEIEVNTDGRVLKFEKKISEEAAQQAPAGAIGKEKAADIALAHAGVTDAKNIRSIADEEDGRAVYEVEFVSGGMEYEYEIDAFTGEVLKAEKELDD